jgi:hypothetical protein
MDNSAHASIYGSRFVRLLSGLSVSDVEVSQNHFAERFGHLVDLSGSITLSMTHEELSALAFKPTGVSSEAIKDEFLRVRTGMVRSIAISFAPSVVLTRDKLPSPKELHAHCKLNGTNAAERPEKIKTHTTMYEPYRKFYINRQRDLDIKIQQLRTHIGDAISGFSPELTQLSTLDKTLGNVLSVRTRKLFSVVPNLLGKRFVRLLDEYWQKLPDKISTDDLEKWMKPGGWISMFCGEMREMLLAELEVRLQPVLGMIDSLPLAITADRTLDEGEDLKDD